MIDSQGERQLRDVLLSLGEYRGDVTVIGGWVPYLYQRYGGFDGWKTNIARTTEVDVVVPSPLERGARRPLAKVLEESGFVPTANTAGAVWTKAAGDEMIELFTHHSGTARQIGRPVSISGQPSISGVSLTHLSLLIEHTFELKLERVRGSDQMLVRVPTLGAYVLNKTLTFSERLSAAEGGLAKAAKDIVYLRDVMAGGEPVRTRVVDDLRKIDADKRQRGEVARAGTILKRLLHHPGTILPIAIEQISEREGTESRPTNAETVGYLEMLAVCYERASENRRRKKSE